MAGKLNGRRIAFLATDGVEAVELSSPLEALKAEGATVHVIADHDGEILGLNHIDHGPSFPVDRTIDAVNAADYDGLVLPGGVVNADKLRTVRAAVDFVRDFMRDSKPVAAICHGPWAIIEAGCVAGRVLTSWPSLQTDVRNAGGAWVDEEVHVDKCLVTSRKPDDLPAFNAHAVELFSPRDTAAPEEDVILKEGKVDQAVEQTFPASDPLPPPSKT